MKKQKMKKYLLIISGVIIVIISLALYWGVYVPKNNQKKADLEKQKLIQQGDEKKQLTQEKLDRFKENFFEPTKLSAGKQYGDYRSNAVVSFCSIQDCKQLLDMMQKSQNGKKVDFPLNSQVVSDFNYWASFDGEAVVRAKYNAQGKDTTIEITDVFSLARLPLQKESFDEQGNGKVKFYFTGKNSDNFKNALRQKGKAESGETELTIGAIAYYGYPYELTPGNLASFINIASN